MIASERRRPPLEAIRVFELAGRYGSFTKAAREIGVTPGAVAHRVRKLEQYLGMELFVRRSGSVTLTAPGQSYLNAVRPCLSSLAQTTEQFRANTGTEALRLVSVEAFAEMWLMPRLPSFRSAHPEIAIEFETSLLDHHAVDPERCDFDVWIAFVAEAPSGVRSKLLFDETLIPVCSPDFLASRGQPEQLADIREWPLLYDLAFDEFWAHWFASRGEGVPNLSRASGYRLYSMMIQAAIYGMGVALGHSRLVAPYLRSGMLKGLLGPPVEAPSSYFLAVAPRSQEKPEVLAFLDWLQAAEAAENAAPAVMLDPAGLQGDRP